MPFTVSHIAAVLPIARVARYRLPLAALAIGSMSPDFGYFINIGLPGRLSHTIGGIFTRCLPIGLAVYLLFHLLVSRPALSLMPQQLADRLAPLLPCREDVTFGRGLLVLAALTLGAFTHICWDSATHRDGAVVLFFPQMLEAVPLAALADMPMYKLLQHASGVFGLAVLAVSVSRWWRRAPAQPPARSSWPVLPAQTRHAVLLAIGLAGGLGAWLGWHTISHASSIERSMFHAVVDSINFMLNGALAFCLAWHLRSWRERRPLASK
jgi:hypothetical protein